MPSFSNILVGVDLSHDDWIATADGETPSHFACEQAVALAAALLESGEPAPSLHFVAVLDLDEKTKRLIAESPPGEDTVVRRAELALKHQVEAASKVGVRSDSSVVMGRSRVELPRRARERGHDLVMVGSSGHGLLSGMLMGSTALTLLSHCQTPVWVVKPSASETPRRILVGTDFSPVCNALFDRGVELARVFDAELHVTHVVERAHVDDATGDARSKLDALAAREDVKELKRPLVVHLEEGTASAVVTEQTKTLDIDLLLFGTVAWGGVPGLFIGSTAQKLLPALRCSLLTMRAGG